MYLTTTIKIKNGLLNYDHRVMYNKYTTLCPCLGCGVVESHLEMAQPTTTKTLTLSSHPRAEKLQVLVGVIYAKHFDGQRARGQIASMQLLQLSSTEFAADGTGLHLLGRKVGSADVSNGAVCLVQIDDTFYAPITASKFLPFYAVSE